MTDADEAPIFTSSATPSVPENTFAVVDVNVTDDNNSEGAGIVYLPGGGPDDSFFILNSISGQLGFIFPPDFEDPQDENGDNIYDVTVRAVDAAGNTATQDIAVTVTNEIGPQLVEIRLAGETVLPLGAITDADAGTEATYVFVFDQDVEKLPPLSTFITAGPVAASVDRTEFLGDGFLPNEVLLAVTFADKDAFLDPYSFGVFPDEYIGANGETNPLTLANLVTPLGTPVTLDTQNPTVVSVTRETPSDETTDADALTFLVTFSEQVAQVDAADFTATGTTASVTNVTGTGATRSVTLSGGDLADLFGVVGLDLAAAPSVSDALGNPLEDTTIGTAETYTVDNTRQVSVSFAGTGGQAVLPEGESFRIGVSVIGGEPVIGEQTVDLDFSGSQADSADFVFGQLPTQITIPDGQSFGSVLINTVDDGITEGDEDLVVTITNPSAGLSIGTPSTDTLTILDSDTDTEGPTLTSFSAPDIGDAENGSGGIEVTVTLEDPSRVLGSSVGSGDVAVTGPSGPLVLNAVQLRPNAPIYSTSFFFSQPGSAWDFTDNGTYTVSFVGDVEDTLGNVSNGFPDQDFTFEVNITPPPTPPEVVLSVTPSDGSEEAGTVFDVTVTASEPVTGDQTVFISFSGAGITQSDFLSVTGPGGVPSSLTIEDGQTEASVTLQVSDDSEVEGEEVATFEISDLTSGIVLGSTTSATFTIEDNDPADTEGPTLTSFTAPDIGDAQAGESTIRVSYTLEDPSLVDASSAPFFVRVFDSMGNFLDDGNFSSPNVDATPLSGFSEFFAPGDSWDFTDNGTYTVSFGGTVADTLGNVSNGFPDQDFTFEVNITPPPTPPEVVLSVTPSDGSEEAGTVFDVTVTASEPVTGDQTVFISFSGAGITQSDFLSVTGPGGVPSSLTIEDGQTEASVTLQVIDDSAVEGEEVATFEISDLTSGIVLGSTTSATFTIEDNDPADTEGPTLTSFTAPDIGDAQAGESTIRVSYTLEDPSLVDASSAPFFVRVIDPMGNTLDDGNLSSPNADATPFSGFSEFFAPGDSWDFTDNGTYEVEFVSDVADTLGNVSNGFPNQDFTFEVNITPPPTPPEVVLSVTPSDGSEEAGTVFDVTVTASEPVTGDQTVFISSSGAGITQSDFLSVTGPGGVPSSLTIEDGQTEASVTLQVSDDSAVEGEEVATFEIATPTSGIVLGSTTSATFTIEDNDDAPPPTVQVMATVTIDGEQKGTGGVDTMQDARDNDLEIGGNDRTGLLFKDVEIPDGAQVTSATLELTSQRAQGGSNQIEIELLDDATIPGLSGGGALTQPGFDTFGATPWSVTAAWANGETVVTPDLSALVQQLLDADPQSDGTYDLLFALGGAGGVRRIVPEEFGTATAATLKLTVGTPAPNAPPVAQDDGATVAEDSGTTDIDVLANDGDPDGDDTLLEVVGIVAGPSNGAAGINPDGTIGYTPDDDFFGADSFDYEVRDEGGATVVATVDVTVTPVQDPPTAVDDVVTEVPGTSLFLDVLGNDSDLDGDDIVIVSVTQGSAGDVQIESGGTELLYLRDTGISGPYPGDQFTYTIEDVFGAQDTATVTIAAETGSAGPPVFDPLPSPVVGDMSTVAIPFSATDPDGNDTITLDAFLIRPNGQPGNPARFDVTDNGDGTAVFTWDVPQRNSDAVYRVDVTADDGDNPTVTESFEITVLDGPAPSGDAPVFDPLTDQTVNEQSTISIPFSATDPDGNDTITLDALLFRPNGQLANPARYDVTDNDDGTALFTWNTPVRSFDGDYTLELTADDGDNPIVTDSLTITVFDIA